MFERFTDRARQVIVLAQEQARTLNHSYIGTEHLLLGLLAEPTGIGGQALRQIGLTVEGAKTAIQTMIGIGSDKPQGHIPFTPRAKKSLEGSLKEALQLNHRYIGTEHLALGLIRDPDGVAAKVIVRGGKTLDEVRTTVHALLAGLGQHGRAAGAGETPEPAPAEVTGPRCPTCSAELSSSTVYKVLPVAEENGEGTAAVLFVYCRSCGRTLDTLIAPEES